MAISQQDIQARIRQIQEAGGGDTAATRAQIAKEAQQYGVTPEQLSRATGVSTANIRNMAAEAGQAFAPMNLAGGTTTPSVSITGGTGGVGMLSGTTQDTFTPQLTKFSPEITSSTWRDAAAGDAVALSGMLLNLGTSGQDVTGFRPYLEDIVTSATGDQGTDPAYAYLVGSASRAIMMNDYNKAVEEGNTSKALELQQALSGDLQSSWEYYTENYEEGSAHGTVQKLFNDPFNIGEPGKYQKSFWDNIGDAVSDAIQNPALQGLVTLAYPPAGAVMNLAGTLDSGDNPSAAQWAAALAGGAEMLDLGGASIIDSLPTGVKEIVENAQAWTEGKWDEAIAAYNRAFPDATTEDLAAFEDGVRAYLGEENIEAVDQFFTTVGDEIATTYGDFSDWASQFADGFLTQADLEAALAGIQTGGGFTAPRGSQAGLGRPRLTKYEGSSVMDIMNQPSSIQKIG